MAKVTGPILSLRASGQIAKSQVYASWKGIAYARQHVIPANPNSTNQQAVRGVFGSMQDLWKRMGTIAQAPWTSFATGKPLTNRNALTSKNVAAMNGKTDRSLFVGSPGSGGGVAPTAVTAAATATAGELAVTITAPAAPAGWTLQAAQAFAMENTDPSKTVPSPIGEAENTTPTVSGDTIVNITGLVNTAEFVAAGWLKWMKPDGTTAYGPSLNGTATPL